MRQHRSGVEELKPDGNHPPGSAPIGAAHTMTDPQAEHFDAWYADWTRRLHEANVTRLAALEATNTRQARALHERAGRMIEELVREEVRDDS